MYVRAFLGDDPAERAAPPRPAPPRRAPLRAGRGGRGEPGSRTEETQQRPRRCAVATKEWSE